MESKTTATTKESLNSQGMTAILQDYINRILTAYFGDYKARYQTDGQKALTETLSDLVTLLSHAEEYARERQITLRQIKSLRKEIKRAILAVVLDGAELQRGEKGYYFYGKDVDGKATAWAKSEKDCAFAGVDLLEDFE